jgi:hypothetical protein
MPAFRFPRSRAARGLGVALAVVVVAWFARHAILTASAWMLVSEDPIAPVQVLVPSHSMPQETALEAALLYRAQISSHIVMTDWVEAPVVAAIRDLGIQVLDSTQLNKYIFERNQVPLSAVTTLAARADGTGSEVAAIAAFVDQCHVSSIMVITARSHTARTRWLLERQLPKGVRLSVRGSRFDGFSVGQWWRQRDQSRELLTEYFRWVNTVLFRDLWARTSPPRPHEFVADCESVTEARSVDAGS